MTTQLEQLATTEAQPRAARASFWKERFRSPRILCLFLALATLAVYCSVVKYGYVDYDDSDYVSANARVQGGLNWENVLWAFGAGHASNWHPLTWLSHMLDWQLFGAHPGAFHLVNLVFHISNTLLLFLVFRRMTGALWRSAFVASLFALHPVHVESVAWISERKDVLSALFFLLTLWAYNRYAELQGLQESRRVTSEKPAPPNVNAQSTPKSNIQKKQSTPSKAISPQPADEALRTPGPVQPSSILHPPSSVFYFLTLALFALGLMAKPMLVTLPCVLLLLDFWPLQRIGFSIRGARFKVQGSKFAVLEKLPFLALALASSIITFEVQQRGGAVSTSLSLGERIANALISYVRYIGKMLWPENLSVLYPHPGHWPVWQVGACAALLFAITAAVLLLARRQPWLAVGWFWFLGTMVPVIGFVQVGIQSMADRYTYIPLIGLFLMLAWTINQAREPGSQPYRLPVGSAEKGRFAHVAQASKPAVSPTSKSALLPASPQIRNGLAVVATVAASLSLTVCACLTARQVQFWRSTEDLFGHAVRVTPRNYLAYNNLGFYFSRHGRADEAIENYRKSLAINPAYEDALNNLGYALAGRKQYREAVPLYEAALRVRPNHIEVHNNLGNALSEIGRLDEAIAHYQVTLKQKPDHADAHNNLGIALAMKGNLAEAVSHFHDAIRYKPNYASAHSNLGNALAVQRKFPEAIREFEESLRLNPNDAQAHNNLGNVLTEQGRVGEAIQHYQRALALNAENPEAHFNLALALLRQNKREEAIPHLTEAVRLKPDYTQARKQLAELANGRTGL